MEKLIEFYRTLCDVMGVSIDENDALYIQDGKIKHPYIIDGRQAYLPTKENIKTMSEYDSNTGEVTIVKTLFNPLSENVSKVTNKSFNKVKRTLEMRLFGAIFYIGEYLLREVVNTEEEVSDIDVIKFASLIGRTKTTSKKIINDKTIANWKKLYDAIATKHINKKYVSFRVVKGGKINNIEYNRTGTIEFPLAELLNSVGKDKVVLDIKLQRNDITSFLSIFEFIAGSEIDIKEGYSMGSLNKLSPSMHVLLTLYSKIVSNITDITSNIKESTESDVIKRMVDIKNIPYDISNISDIIDSFANELRNIPTEAGAITKAKVEQPVNSGFGNIAKDEPKKTGWGSVKAVDPKPISNNYKTPTNPVDTPPWEPQQVQQPVQQPMQPYMQQPVQSGWGNTQPTPPNPSRVPPPPNLGNQYRPPVQTHMRQPSTSPYVQQQPPRRSGW